LFRRSLVSVLVITAIVCASSWAPARASAQKRVAVLPFIVHLVGVNDEVTPRPDELMDLRQTFDRDLDANRAFHAVALNENCDVDRPSTCARSAAEKSGASVAVLAYVTRYMALLWSLDFQVVDARSGRVYGPWRNVFKGDFDGLIHAMPQIATEVRRVIDADGLSRRNQSPQTGVRRRR
jgi:hypothetical protein